MILSAQEALERLQEGNRRFAASEPTEEIHLSHAERTRLVRGQNPFAIVLGCSDSRAPAEIVFDQGPGALFVIRVAGNIVAPTQLGSIEFAAERFGTRLIVVLGHSHCGAIDGALEHIENPIRNLSPNVSAILDRVRPAVEEALRTEPQGGREVVVRRAIRANVSAATDHLRHDNEIVSRLIRDEGVRVVGAEYSLETGIVEFFDGMDAIKDV